MGDPFVDGAPAQGSQTLTAGSRAGPWKQGAEPVTLPAVRLVKIPNKGAAMAGRVGIRTGLGGLAIVVFGLALVLLGAGRATGATISSTELKSGWALRSATNVTDTGATISQVGYSTTGWYPITLPSTVLAGLVANNVYQNIYFSTNLQSVPDLTGQNWWYRGEFTAPAASAGQAYWLRFKGISYRAQIWLNGTQLDANAVGTMVVHEYNVTNLIHPGAANAVAVLVTPPQHGCKDLSFCTVDWNPEAPD